MAANASSPFHLVVLLMGSVTAVSDLPPPTWDMWRDLMERSTRSDAGRQGGLWALDVLQRELGDDWVERAWRRDGAVPDFIRLSFAHAIAFAELLDLALRLHLLRDVPGAGRVRKELRGDPRLERLIHTRIQLEVGALGAYIGDGVTFEANGQGGPVDVSLVTPAGTMTVETFAMLMDDRMRTGQGFWDELSGRMLRIGFAHDVTFDGQVERRLEPIEVDELLMAAEETAAEVKSDGRMRPLVQPGVHLRVLPTLQADGTRFSGPAETSRGWPRTVDILTAKAEQARRSGARWLRANAHDGLWQFTQWAGYDLPRKAAALAPWVRQAVGSRVGLDGVAVSSGDVFGQGTFEAESVVLREGTCGLRRILAPLRVRETIIVPLTQRGRNEAAHWAELYDREADWLGWALEKVGLRSADEVMGWQPIT